MTTTTPSSRIKEIVLARITDKDEISIPAVTDAVVATLVEDEDFMQSFMQEKLRSAVYALVQELVARSRNLSGLGDLAVSAAGMEKRAERFADRFLNWYENTANGRSVRLMEATREDLLEAAEARQSRGLHEIRLATWLRRVAAGLEGGQRVSERYTAEQIETLFGAVQGVE